MLKNLAKTKKINEINFKRNFLSPTLALKLRNNDGSSSISSNGNISSLNSKTIEIQNLPLNISTLDLLNEFRNYKISPHGIKTKYNNEKGCCYITFENNQDFMKAIDKKIFSFNNSNYSIQPIKQRLSSLFNDEETKTEAETTETTETTTTPNTTIQHENVNIISSLNSNHYNHSISYPNQSAITQQLWFARVSKEVNPALTEAPKLTTKTPEDSKVEIVLPFSTDLQLRENYLSPYGNLRIGRFLEDLDAIATAVAFKHGENENDGYKKMFVTVSVDTIKILRPLIPDRDIKMEAKLSWVGNSSMEIMIRVFSKDNQTQIWDPVLVAFFTMVGVDPKTMKPTNINSLKVETHSEKRLFAEGEQHKLQRLNSNQQSLEKIPPTPTELETIHNLFMISKQQQQQQSSSSSYPSSSIQQYNSNFIPMKSTSLETVILCQPQEKNINGQIFGGYLMRMAFETAFTTCFMKFSESLPRFRSISGLKFLKPVEIGDILNMESTITYSKPMNDDCEGQTYYTQVEVLAYVTDPSIGEKKLSNVFNFTFYCTPSKSQKEKLQQQQQQHNSNKKLKQILPQTYSEAMRYLTGKRIIDSYIEFEQSPSKMDVFKND
ncbi:hypothetical protein RB653_003884 [Dictyostelium firmibasis]|uniref:HotDog ACOT-type domain-containing protein n=1 Tax=Dictyostelium firmibasis TaxID=79012 RepID=A0AAN7YWE5_9MYCE